MPCRAGTGYSRLSETEPRQGGLAAHAGLVQQVFARLTTAATRLMSRHPALHRIDPARVGDVPGGIGWVEVAGAVLEPSRLARIQRAEDRRHARPAHARRPEAVEIGIVARRLDLPRLDFDEAGAGP